MLVVWADSCDGLESAKPQYFGGIPDHRAREFWDQEHLVAAEIARITEQKSVRSEPDCCVRKGFHWDEVALYAADTGWTDGTPTYWNGPVYRIASALEKALNEQQ